LINSTQIKNNTVMSKNKTAVITNSLNTSTNNNHGGVGVGGVGVGGVGVGGVGSGVNGYLHGNINAVQKTQVSSTVGKAGLESIMGQKMVGPKISTIKR
jgi:hypothetical protein